MKDNGKWFVIAASRTVTKTKGDARKGNKVILLKKEGTTST